MGNIIMKTIDIGKYKKFYIHTYFDDKSNPWFNANSICKILKFDNPNEAIKKHVHENDRVSREIIDSFDQFKNIYYINQAGLYDIIYANVNPEAKKFEKWITYKVSALIHRYHLYGVDVDKDEDEIEDSKINYKNIIKTKIFKWLSFSKGEN